MSNTFRGVLSIDTDEAGLEATITWIPDPGGTVYSKAKILEELYARDIKNGIDEQALTEFCAEAQSASGGSLSCIAAHGLAAKHGAPPRPLMADLKLPPELEETFRALIPKDAPPRIFSFRTEKQKVEKIIRKATLLPFLPAREEKKTVWLRKQTAHAVMLEAPRERGRAYVTAGTCVASLQAAVRPENGLSIFGREIPADPAGAEEIYLGEHLEQSDTEVRATRNGFLRYGETWIELFPFAAHTFSLDRDPDGTTCRLDFEPGSASSPVPAAISVLAAAEALGFSRDTLWEEAEIRSLLEDAVAARRSVSQQSISRDLDAEIRVSVSDDKMQALLSLRKGRGDGESLHLRAIGEAIRSQSLKGMDTSRIEKDVLTFFYGPELVLGDCVLSEGTRATAGEAGNLVWQARFLAPPETAALKTRFLEQSAALETLESHTFFPQAEIEEMAWVMARESIARIEPATAGQSGFDVFGRLVPGILGPEPQIELYENLRFISNEIVSVCAGILEKRTADGVAHLRVRQHQDSRVEVEVAENQMEAFLTLLPAQGTGAVLSKEAVLTEIALRGVLQGIDKQLLARAIMAARAGKEVRRLCFARGTAAVPPHLREPRFLQRLATGRSVTLTDGGRADYKQQDKLTVIEAGSLVAELPAPAPGQDGWTVTGRPLPAAGSAEPPLAAGRNVEERRDDDGGSRFLATATGELYCHNGLLEVLNVHVISGDVGLETGNINFSGFVQIDGSVSDGFHVIASDSISVSGTVQSALLSAGDSITVRGGIKGGLKAVLRARRNIFANFAEQAILLCVGDIRVQNACLRCEIKCNGRLSLESEKGRLLGGHVSSRGGLEARNLGSERGIKTMISFGQDYLLRDRIQREEKLRRQRQERLRELDQRLSALARVSRAEELAAIRRQKLALLKRLDSQKQQLFLLREKFEEHFPSQIIVRDTVFPGVVFESHGRRHEIVNKSEKVVFYFNTKTAKIEVKPLEAKAKETPCSPSFPSPPG